MKRLVFSIIPMMLGAAVSAQPGNNGEALRNELEVRGFQREGLTAKLYLEKPVTERFALNLTAFKARGWDELIVGPTFHFSPQMSLALGAGVSRYRASGESAPSSHGTLSASWFWSTETWGAEALVERYGRDPAPWYREGYLQKRIDGGLSAGLFAKSGSGWGPRLSYDINRQANIWVASFVKQTGEAKVVLGIKVSF